MDGLLQKNYRQERVALSCHPGALKPTSHPAPFSATGRSKNSAAIRAAAHRALAARDHLLSDYPLWEAWRRQARASKSEAVARQDELLDDLEQAVTAWGGRVLRARDAAEARRIILDVAREHGIKTVVKAKSMTTEEIGLNPALAAAGLQAIETDLGEFIVQLAGHPPAHLTAPALHLNRRQIAEIFADRLGLRSPAEPEALTRLAAAYLNPHFWTAQMGITGVNFATPEGILVLLENESNLRFAATLPKVHLALMGREKLVPRLMDLEVMLRLLPASATGQRLTSLVHFIRGLKAQPQGDQAFYLVILDNGRRRLAADPELAEALYCFRCGACLNVCPIFQVGAAHLYGRVYPGAIGILLAPYLGPVGDIADLCTQCGACQEICPVGIRLMEKIRVLRRHSRRFRQLRVLSTAAGAVLSRPRWYRGLEPVWRRLAGLPVRDWTPAGLPPLAPESFYQRQGGRQSGSPSDAKQQGRTLRSVASGLHAEESGGSLKEADLAPDISGRPHESAPTLAFLAQRLQEVGSSLAEVQGPADLAGRLAAAARPLWLADHPWLRRLAAELEKLGVSYHMAKDDWAPEAGTAVTIALGAIPETGSVLVDSGGGPGAVLAFRARKHIVLVPRGNCGLSLAQALKYVQDRGPGLVSWLTGPSRTADIEKVLVLGAQGPANLEIILYQEEE
jgi:L-lactate dehydrogenase complex protein LldF